MQISAEIGEEDLRSSVEKVRDDGRVKWISQPGRQKETAPEPGMDNEYADPRAQRVVKDSIKLHRSTLSL